MKTKIFNGLQQVNSQLVNQFLNNSKFKLKNHLIKIRNKDGSTTKAILIELDGLSYVIKINAHEISQLSGNHKIDDAELNSAFSSDDTNELTIENDSH